MLRDGPWANQPVRIDRTTIDRPTPEAFQPVIATKTIEVLPLVQDLKAQTNPGWCTYSEPFDSPEMEVLCGGINHKTSTAAAIWRQGNLLHFGFDLEPAQMNERAQALLVNSTVYIARFTEDRPITNAPGRALLRGGADRITAKPAAEPSRVDWYFARSTRLQGKASDWPAFQSWYKQHRDYLRADPKEAGSLVWDEDAEKLGSPPHRPGFFPAAIAALREGGPKAELAARLLRRYAPDGPQEAKPEAWQAWREANERYAFFSESGWYRWYVDPLAKKRGIPTAELRGSARATR